MGKSSRKTRRPRPATLVDDAGQLCRANAGHVAELEELYAQVPEVNCRGLCQEACGPIGMGDAEYARLQEVGAPPMRRADKVLVRFEAMSCPLLTILGQCSVYQLRPMVCRIWGAVVSMRCEHGCRPEGGWLPEVDGQVLLLKAMRVGATRRERQRLDQLITALQTTPEVSEAMAAWVTMKGHSGISEHTQAQLLAELEEALMAAGKAAHKARHRRR